MAREAQLESMFRREVKRLGGITIKIAPIEVGVPDRLVLLPGRPAVLVELKAEGGQLRPAQVVWHRRAEAIGHPVVTLVGRVEILRWLGDLETASSTPANGLAR